VTLGALADESARVDDLSIRPRTDLHPATWHDAVGILPDRLCLPEIDEKALAGLNSPRRFRATLQAPWLMRETGNCFALSGVTLDVDQSINRLPSRTAACFTSQ
jgi:hypothetical protein